MEDLLKMTSSDTWRRRARVYLYSDDLRASSDSLPSSGRGNIGFSWLFRLLGYLPIIGKAFMHWGVIVDYGRGKTYTIDGGVRDKLWGGEFVVWVTPAWPNRSSIRCLRPIDTITCAPSELLAEARATFERVPCKMWNFDVERAVYHPVLVNCQVWGHALVEALREKFGASEPSSIVSSKTKESIPFLRMWLTLRAFFRFVLPFFLFVNVLCKSRYVALGTALFMHVFYLSVNPASFVSESRITRHMFYSLLHFGSLIGLVAPAFLIAVGVIAILILAAFDYDLLPDFLVNLCAAGSFHVILYFIFDVPLAPILLWVTVFYVHLFSSDMMFRLTPLYVYVFIAFSWYFGALF